MTEPYYQGAEPMTVFDPVEIDGMCETVTLRSSTSMPESMAVFSGSGRCECARRYEFVVACLAEVGHGPPFDLTSQSLPPHYVPSDLADDWLNCFHRAVALWGDR